MLGIVLSLFNLQGRPWGCPWLRNLGKLDSDSERLVGYTASCKMVCEGTKEWAWKMSEINERDVLDWTPLHYAASHPSRHAALLHLLPYRPAINAQDVRKRTPLHLACRHNEESVIESLLQAGADIDSQDIAGLAPIHYAAIHGQARTVQLLVTAGANTYVTDRGWMTPLFWAVFKGHIEVVDVLWAHSKSLLRDSNGRAILHFAAVADADETSRHEMVKYLLEKKVDTGVKDNDGCTPLLIAVKLGHEGVVDLLLKAGKYPWGGGIVEEAIHYATCHGETAILEMLLDSQPGLQVKDIQFTRTLNESIFLLGLAARYGHDTTVELLLKRGASINCEDITEDGKTALQMAAEKGRIGVMKLLLEGGADVNLIKSVADIAAYRNEAAVVLLVEKGIDITKRSIVGDTVLFAAADEGQKDLVNALLARGIDINAEHSSRSTPLHRAAANGHEAVAVLLMENGGDIGSVDRGGRTLLHKAAGNGLQELVKLLLKRDMNIEARD